MVQINRGPDADDQDFEASAFAMELLMPFDWIVRDSAGVDLCDDDGVARLAKRYRVPVTTMAVRIGEVRAEMAERTPSPNPQDER